MSDLGAYDEEITPAMRAEAGRQYLLYGIPGYGLGIVEPGLTPEWRSVYST